MLKKCVSLGGAGNPAQGWDPSTPHVGEPLADMWAGLTSDQLFNTSYFANTSSNTPWVRLFAETDFIFPLPPTSRVSPRGRYRMATPNPAQLARLDQNIAQAKHAGLGVMLTLRGFAPWANNTPGQPLVLPPNNALLVWGGPPPSPGAGYQPNDFAWALWAHFLMDRYHPYNTSKTNPVVSVPDWSTESTGLQFVNQRAYVDYFEIVNEPYGECSPQPGVPDYHSTALMMIAGQYLNAGLNKTYPPPRGKPRLISFAPATADNPGYSRFIRNLIAELKTVSYTIGRTTLRFTPKDPTFAWSQHNYSDVENIAPYTALGSAGDALLAAAGVTGRYGPSTQHVRDLLRGGGTPKSSGPSWWQGYRSESSTPQPALWLTEGGGRLEHLNGWVPGGDSDLDQTAAKQTQQQVIQKTIAALQSQGPGQPGQGVEMFTNFLFYDEPPTSINHSGLCNSYPYPGIGSLESSAYYERPAFTAWSAWTQS